MAPESSTALGFAALAVGAIVLVSILLSLSRRIEKLEQGRGILEARLSLLSRGLRRVRARERDTVRMSARELESVRMKGKRSDPP